MGELEFVDLRAFEGELERVLPRRTFGSMQQALALAFANRARRVWEPCAPFDVAEYQRTCAGRAGDRLALVHLFALPLQRAGRWDARTKRAVASALRSRTAFLIRLRHSACSGSER